VSKYELPETLGWYRDSAHWMLGLSLGGLSGFIGLAGFSEKIMKAGWWPKGLFFAAGASVLIAVVAGVLFTLYLGQCGNALERKHALDQNQTVKDPEKTRLANEIAKQKSDAEKGYNRYYWILVPAFFTSLVCFTIVGIWMLTTPSDKAESPPFELITTSGPLNQNRSQLLALNKTNHLIFRYVPASNIWVSIPPPPVRVEREPAISK
jgi:hypothetical protein